MQQCLVARYARVELLILDELAYVPLAQPEAELLFQVLDERSERSALIVTTNLPLGSGPRSSPSPGFARRWSTGSRSTPTSWRPGPTAGGSRRRWSDSAGRGVVAKRPGDSPGPGPTRLPNAALSGSCGLVSGRCPRMNVHRRGVGPNQIITVGPRGVCHSHRRHLVRSVGERAMGSAPRSM